MSASSSSLAGGGGQLHEVGEVEAGLLRVPVRLVGVVGDAARSIVAVSSPATHRTAPSLRTAERLVWVPATRDDSSKCNGTVRSTGTPPTLARRRREAGGGLRHRSRDSPADAATGAAATAARGSSGGAS